MAYKVADRVKETSTTTGTGTYTLAGAVDASYVTFSAGIGDGHTCTYVAFDSSGYETGIGTIGGGGTTLARTTVRRSSNGNAAVDWAAGTRTLFVDTTRDGYMYPLRRCAVKLTSDQTISNDSQQAITWDAEESDVFAWHAASDDEITVDVTGLYDINLNLNFVTNGTGIRGGMIAVNGTEVARQFGAASGSLVAGLSLKLDKYPLTAGDVVRGDAYQNSGGNLDLRGSGSGFLTRMSVTLVGVAA